MTIDTTTHETVDGTALRATVAFTDRDGNAATPTAVQWGVFDTRDGTALIALTSFAGTLGTSIVIDVPPAGTACAESQRTRSVELVVVAQFNDDDDDQVTQRKQILIHRARGV